MLLLQLKCNECVWPAACVCVCMHLYNIVLCTLYSVSCTHIIMYRTHRRHLGIIHPTFREKKRITGMENWKLHNIYYYIFYCTRRDVTWNDYGRLAHTHIHSIHSIHNTGMPTTHYTHPLYAECTEHLYNITWIPHVIHIRDSTRYIIIIIKLCIILL